MQAGSALPGLLPQHRRRPDAGSSPGCGGANGTGGAFELCNEAGELGWHGCPSKCSLLAACPQCVSRAPAQWPTLHSNEPGLAGGGGSRGAMERLAAVVVAAAAACRWQARCASPGALRAR